MAIESGEKEKENQSANHKIHITTKYMQQLRIAKQHNICIYILTKKHW